MTRPSRTLVAACAAVIPLSLAIAGCGGDGIDSDAVAKVGDTQISKSAFEDTVVVEKVVASQQLRQGKLFDAKVPKLVSFAAPYTECIAELKKTTPKDQKVPDSQFKQICSGAEKSIKDQAVTRLVVEQFLNEEAEKLKIPVTEKDIDKGLDAKLTQAIGGKKNIPKFTALTGLGIESFRDQVRFELISQKIQEKFTKDAGKATPAEVQREYDKNKKQYTQPELRNLRVVLTKKEPEAAAAKKAIDGGEDFAAVAKKSSIDPITKKTGGELENVAQGQQEKALGEAAFKAKKGEVVGPVKTETGYYVFRVEKITPSRLVPFKDVKAQIKQQLDTQKPQAAIQKWQTESIKGWTAKTTCREGYVVQYCKNAPPPATTGAAPAKQAPAM